jgi:hypothetical protein
MNLAKLTHSYHISLAEKQATKTRNQANLTRIASALQQHSNRQILQSIGEFLNVCQKTNLGETSPHS